MEKIIHNIWVGPYKLPKMTVYFMERSKKINSSYEHVLWKDDNLPELPDKIKQHCDFWREKENYAFIADILRVYLVYEYGGFYLDIDTRPNNSIEELKLENYNGILPYHNEYTVANGFFGCAKKTSYIVHQFNRIMNANVGNDFMPYWFNSGIKEHFKIKEVHDYASEECQIVGKQLLKAWEDEKIMPIAINGDFKKYYEHFALYSWSAHHKKYFEENNENYIDDVYKINYRID